MEKIKLNLGCGLDIRKGWVNLDAIKTKGVDVIHNLNKYPYPFKDDTFDEIFASHIIEHLPDTVSFIKEIWRISKPNAKIIIKTDHYSGGSLGWGDPEHQRVFSSQLFHNYNIKFMITGSGASLSKEKFKVIRIRLRFGKLHTLLGISWLMNRHIDFY